MKITTVGVDLAKRVIQVHGVNERGQVVLSKALKREQVLAWFARLQPCLVGMEACGGAHHWARKLSELGHTVKLMAPQYVKPYVKSNKSDRADAEAICEAVRRPNMRFVAPKTLDQQGLLCLHSARQGLVKARTAQGNQIRGLLAEFGVVLPQGLHQIARGLPGILEDESNGLPGLVRGLIRTLAEHLTHLGTQIQALEQQIKLWHRDNEASRRLEQVPGIGPITASALIASVGDARQFRNARQLAAWLGLVPRQHSSGGKQRLLGISKRGDVYLRTLLIHGARSVMRHHGRSEPSAGWLGRLMQRRHPNIAAVALANKNARIVWALLAQERTYRSDWAMTRAAA